MRMDILIVDDDIAVASALSGTVERLNHNVETASTGKDALKKLKQKKFHLMLLDIFLPDCMGYEFIPKFKEIWAGLGIVTMTGYNSRELERRVRQQGLIYYMLKPINTKELKEVINHLSKKKRKELRK